MTRRIFFKLTLIVAGLLALVGLGAQFLVGRITAENLRTDLQRSLAEKARLTQFQLESLPPSQYADVVDDLSLRARARVTVIDSNGVVLAESDADPAGMENHADRPEFLEALRGRQGVSIRYSETIDEDMLYVAEPIDGGAVRLALSLHDIDVAVSEIRGQVFRMVALAIAPALILALFLSRSVSNRLSAIIAYSGRLAEGDFQSPLPEAGNGELGELTRSLNTTGKQLRSMFEQLQEERSRFAAAVNGIGEGILVADRKLRIVLFNPAMEQMLPDVEIYKGASLKDWHAEEIPQLFADVLETGEPCSVDLQLDPETDRSWKISCAPILSRKGKVHAVVAVFYDITELDRVDRMRKDFVINVSHELRTPLAAIQGYAETLLDGAIDEPGVNRRFMKILWQNAERLAQLTADLMTLSQIEVNTREFAFSRHNVGDLLEEAVRSIVLVADKKKIRVEVEPVDPNLEIDCDSGAVHQILNNLLDNAAKYSPEGGTIHVGAAERDLRVEFHVRDTGIGIPAEHIPRLFERFYRVDKARSRELGGTGLGLAIVKHLVLAHHGSVRVESEPGQGSTFYFELPIRQSAELAAPVDLRQQALF